MAELDKRLQFTSQDIVGVREALSRATAELERIEDQLREVRQNIAQLREEKERARAFLDQSAIRARVGGKIELYLSLQGIENGEDRMALEAEQRLLSSEIDELRGRIDYDGVEERLGTFLGAIGQTMTSWARAQNLEYANGLLGFDLRGPTLVSRTTAETIPLARFGSGRNWVWYHLIGHLALHDWFVDKLRPVPRFLVFDQPSQVYFPSETPESRARARDEVKRIYKWLIERTDELCGQLQVIVTDHADFDEQWFRGIVAHDWWINDGKLVPDDWA